MSAAPVKPKDVAWPQRTEGSLDMRTTAPLCSDSPFTIQGSLIGAYITVLTRSVHLESLELLNLHLNAMLFAGDVGVGLILSKTVTE